MTMKYEWRKYVDEMRRDGYVVVVITPDELKMANSMTVHYEATKAAYTQVDIENERLLQILSNDD